MWGERRAVWGVWGGVGRVVGWMAGGRVSKSVVGDRVTRWPPADGQDPVVAVGGGGEHGLRGPRELPVVPTPPAVPSALTREPIHQMNHTLREDIKTDISWQKKTENKLEE